jgi:hypothetical protein
MWPRRPSRWPLDETQPGLLRQVLGQLERHVAGQERHQHSMRMAPHDFVPCPVVAGQRPRGQIGVREAGA